jgi:hypothetical protein
MGGAFAAAASALDANDRLDQGDAPADRRRHLHALEIDFDGCFHIQFQRIARKIEIK